MVLAARPPFYLLDANACNARQKIEELNELEEFSRRGLIVLQHTETTWNEAMSGAGPGALSRDRKVADFVFTGLAGVSELEERWRNQIARILFPSGTKDLSQEGDVRAVLTAKLAGGIFVTRDGGSKTQPGGILGHKAELAALGIVVLSFPDALRHAVANAGLPS
jgi:hypothetical protein